MHNELKIVGGEWRSRKITFDAVEGLRPTPVRVRETLFNWLQHDILGSRCLDLFSGSGALGFEAASRGAKRVVMVESNLQVCRKLQANVALLQASQVRIYHRDVIQWLREEDSAQDETFDLVFLDPPFADDCVLHVCKSLESHGWLSNGAKVYIETPAKHKLQGLPVNWQRHRHKIAGEVGYTLFIRYNPVENSV